MAARQGFSTRASRNTLGIWTTSVILVAIKAYRGSHGEEANDDQDRPVCSAVVGGEN